MSDEAVIACAVTGDPTTPETTPRPPITARRTANSAPAAGAGAATGEEARRIVEAAGARVAPAARAREILGSALCAAP